MLYLIFYAEVHLCPLCQRYKLLSHSVTDCDSSRNLSHTLVGKTVKSKIEAFELYNNHAYKIGFSIRKAKQKTRPSTKALIMKRFVCSKEGTKREKGKINKCYPKVDICTVCKAMIKNK